MVRLEETGELYGPELPESHDWPTATRGWWETWRRSALAPTLTSVDWSFLADTALVHAAFWAGDTKVADELRLRVACYGATPADRMRLRLQVVVPASHKPNSPRPATDKDRR